MPRGERLAGLAVHLAHGADGWSEAVEQGRGELLTCRGSGERASGAQALKVLPGSRPKALQYLASSGASVDMWSAFSLEASASGFC